MKTQYFTEEDSIDDVREALMSFGATNIVLSKIGTSYLALMLYMKGEVTARLLDVNGNVMSNVTVTVNGKTIKTSATGEFSYYQSYGSYPVTVLYK